MSFPWPYSASLICWKKGAEPDGIRKGFWHEGGGEVGAYQWERHERFRLAAVAWPPIDGNFHYLRLLKRRFNIGRGIQGTNVSLAASRRLALGIAIFH